MLILIQLKNTENGNADINDRMAIILIIPDIAVIFIAGGLLS